MHISRFSRESIISQQRRRENTPDYLALTVYKRIAEEFIQNIDSLTDEQKKILAKMMIEKIEIFTEKQEDGRWVKSVQFKIPMKIGDEIVDTLEIESLESYQQGNDDSLSNEEHVETVCLLSRQK